MYGPGRLHLGKVAVGTHLLPLLLLFAATCLLPTGLDLYPVSQRGPASFADEAAIFNSTTTITAMAPVPLESRPVVHPSCGHEAVADLLATRGGSPTTMLPSSTSTAAIPVSTPTIDELPDVPPDIPASPFPELGLTTDDPEYTWLSPVTPYSFPDEFHERHGGLLAGYRGDDLSDPEDDDVCDLDEPQQQGYTEGMPWVQFSDASASDLLEDTQIYEQPRFTINPTVIDPRVGMSVPAANMHLLLDICPAPRPLTTAHTTSAQILSTTSNAIPIPNNAHAGPGFNIDRIPNEIVLEILRYLLVFPGQLIRMSESNHPTGEPVLQVATSGQPIHNDLPLPPLRDLLAVAATNLRLRRFAFDVFFGHNTFDLTCGNILYRRALQRNPLRWIRGVPILYQESLMHVEISLYLGLGPVTYREKRRINTENMIREIGKSHTLRSVTIKVRVPYGIQSLTPAEKRQRFLQMPELDLLSRLRGVDHLVVQAPFALGAPETARLQQCLAKPKGRRGRGDQPHLYPALALRPLSSDTLVRRPWSELDSELESYGGDPADFSTKISKAKKLEGLRRLDWKNPDEPDEP
ncbi:hypothetical protein J4E85_001579 [Alternaria conjuncta]|uniref:uncharacterized protein n=1 Tax=Alternaria conjuncta TaxID=181017 RepID=UPI002221146B|nr:uncharacterized protein J4E85_001579 [Alternaria conjuncta]KAI4936250.1 hypothetical protein J4E85_001579 [Alternaria conjuncta]